MELNIVPARTGILWVKLGVQTFLKQPLALTGLFFMYMAAVLLISQIPFLGMVLGAMLVPGGHPGPDGGDGGSQRPASCPRS